MASLRAPEQRTSGPNRLPRASRVPNGNGPVEETGCREARRRKDRMSHSGQSLPKCDVRDMSGFPSIATEERTSRDVSNVPIGDIPGLAWYACCKDDCEGRDSRLLLNGEPLQLGQTRRIGFVFLSPDSAAIFKSAGKYLWEGRIIGEAVVQPKIRTLSPAALREFVTPQLDGNSRVH